MDELPKILVPKLVRRIFKQFDFEENVLDPKILSQLRNLVRSDANLIESLMTAMYEALHAPDCGCRLACVHLIDYFFVRSHDFRTNFINDIQDFLCLTVETDPQNYPLPLPLQVAQKLKKFSLECMKKWHLKYSVAYPKLSLSFEYLQTRKKADLASLAREGLREEEERRRKDAIAQRLFDRMTSEYAEVEGDIHRCLIEMESVFQILCPLVQRQNEGQGCVTDKNNCLQLHGIHLEKSANEIEINIDFTKNPISVTREQEALVTCLTDNATLVSNRYLPHVSKLCKSLGKVGQIGQNLLKSLIDTKQTLEAQMQKCNEMNLPVRHQLKPEVDEDDELVDVLEKEGVEFGGVEDPLPQYIAEYSYKQSNIQTNDQEDQPCCSTQLKKAEIDPTQKPFVPTSAKSAGAADASIPIRQFGLDLKYWEQKKFESPCVARNNSDCHRFWRPKEEGESASQNNAESVYRTRVFEFAGQFEPVTRQCNHPLKSGGRCRRFDRVKCPFHGKIVERAEQGEGALKPNFGDELPSTSTSRDMPWEDEELIKDIQTATGNQIQVVKKGGGPKKKISSVRHRLQTKVFNPKTLKRVCETLDAIQDSKNKQKFANQFNYALE